MCNKVETEELFFPPGKTVPDGTRETLKVLSSQVWRNQCWIFEADAESYIWEFKHIFYSRHNNRYIIRWWINSLELSGGQTNSHKTPN